MVISFKYQLQQFSTTEKENQPHPAVRLHIKMHK